MVMISCLACRERISTSIDGAYKRTANKRHTISPWSQVAMPLSMISIFGHLVDLSEGKLSWYLTIRRREAKRMYQRAENAVVNIHIARLGKEWRVSHVFHMFALSVEVVISVSLIR